MPTLEIFDKEQISGDELFSVLIGMPPILRAVGEFGAQLDWYVVELEVVVFRSEQSDDSGEWVSEVLREVKSSKVPTKLSWEGVKRFAKNVGQIEGCLIIGVYPGRDTPKEPIDLNSSSWQLVIQCLDVSLWAVTTRDEDLLDRMRSSFSNTKTVPITSRYY